MEFNEYQKSEKTPFIIYADLECLIEKIVGCQNNPENSSTTKVGKHIPSSLSTMSTISCFKSMKISIVYTEVKFVWKCFVNL